jgi:hypothetical protein
MFINCFSIQLLLFDYLLLFQRRLRISFFLIHSIFTFESNLRQKPNLKEWTRTKLTNYCKENRSTGAFPHSFPIKCLSNLCIRIEL